MMISHDYKCIYIHIPKTAGQSIHNAFVRNLGYLRGKNAPLHLHLVNQPEVEKEVTHLKASDYVHYGHVSQEIFDEYFKFAFVRNPWSRIVSEYRYRNHPRKYDFKTFLFKHLPEPDLSDIYIHTIPQYDFLYDENGNLLVDMVCRFENLQSEFDKVCKEINFPITPLPHRNKSLAYKIPRNIWDAKNIVLNKISKNVKKNTFPHYRDYYDDETKEFVAKLYERDIEAFGYTF